ncbi:MAG: tetratricopeptide repeat protein, partial [Gemmatimonadaceae bacterium]
IEQVVARTDGIPVFVEELTRMVLELGLVSDGAPVTTATLPPLLDIPETLQDSLLARLDRLGEAKEVAQIGAVLGRVFPYDLLLATAQFEESVLQRHLARLVDAELLYQRGSLPNASFTFKHALIQDAAYALLLRSSRRKLHERVARVLLSDFPARAAQQPELVALHFTEAAQFVEAIQQWQQAGMQSLQHSASVEAVAQLRRGLSLLGQLPESPLRSSFELGLLTTLGAAYASTMGYAAPDTAQTYARATELSDELGDVPDLFWAIRGVWSAALVRGDLLRALEIGERLLRTADAGDRDELRMEAHYALGATHMFMGDMPRARPHFARVTALDYPARDLSGRLYTAVDVVASSTALAAQTAWLLGLSDEADRLMRESLTMVDVFAHPVSQAFVQNQAATLGYLNGTRDVVRHHAGETIRLSETYGIFFAPIGALVMGWATDDAATSEGMLAMLRGGGSHVGNTMFYCMLAEAQWRSGNVKAAEQSIDDALAIVTSNHEGYWEPELYKLRGDIAAQEGRTAAAEGAYRSAIDCATTRGLVALKRRAEDQLATLAKQRN